MLESYDISDLAARRTERVQKDTSKAQRPWIQFHEMGEVERKGRGVEGQWKVLSCREDWNKKKGNVEMNR